MYVWVNQAPPGVADALPAAGGWLVPEWAACVSTRDRGLLLGDALFETMRVVGSRVPLLSRHLDRLREGCRLLGFPDGPTDPLPRAVTSLLRANGITAGYVRITCTRGAGGRGYEPPDDAEPLAIVHAGPWRPPEHAFTVAISDIPTAPHPVLSRVKHTSALPNILWRQEAHRRGCDEILILNTRGHLVEGAATNIFWVRDGKTYTPAPTTGCLPGIARAFVLERERVAEGAFLPESLRDAEEVLLTNALLGVVGVQEVRGLGAWPAPGPVTRRLQAAWNRLLAPPAPHSGGS